MSGWVTAAPATLPAGDLVERIGCTTLTAVPEIATRLRGRVMLFKCYRGGELTHRRISYVELKPGGYEEYRSMVTFAARFGPFTTDSLATAAALAFSEVSVDQGSVDVAEYRELRAPAARIATKQPDGSFEIVTYDFVPHQGQCEVRAVYEEVVQVSSDGQRKILRREKIYEHNQKEKVCVD